MKEDNLPEKTVTARTLSTYQSFRTELGLKIDFKTNRQVIGSAGHNDAIRKMRVSEQNKLVYSCDKNIFLATNLNDGRTKFSYPICDHYRQHFSITQSHDRILVHALKNELHIIHALTGKLFFKYISKTQIDDFELFDKANKIAAVTGSELIIWDTDKPDSPRLHHNHDGKKIHSLHKIDDTIFATSGESEKYVFYSIDDEQLMYTIDDKSGLHYLNKLPSRKGEIFISTGNQFHLFNYLENEIIQTFSLAKEAVCIALIDDKNLLLTHSKDNLIKIWDFKSMEVLRSFESNYFQSWRLSQDTHTLGFFSSNRNRLFLLDLNTLSEIVLPPENRIIDKYTFLPDNEHIAAISDE